MNLTRNMLMQLPLLLLFLSSMNGVAQSKWKASLGTQMQFSELKADDGLLKTSIAPGAGINLGISYQLNDNLSLHSGIGFSYIQSRSSVANFSNAVDAIDSEGEDFDFRYVLRRYSERQQSALFSIPVALQYESNGNQTRFYSKIGASANFFLSPTSEGRANRIVTSGFFERFNAELTVPRFAGFGTFNEIEFTENDLDIKNSFNAFLEIGVKENFETGWIYVGLFAEYGLNNLLENNGSSLVEYNPNDPINFINNSSLNSSIENTPLFGKVSLNTIGLRVKYEFGI